jgi:hypothetical protein
MSTCLLRVCYMCNGGGGAGWTQMRTQGIATLGKRELACTTSVRFPIPYPPSYGCHQPHVRRLEERVGIDEISCEGDRH